MPEIELDAVTGVSVSGERFEGLPLGVVLGGFSLRCDGDLGVWRRLLDDAGISFQTFLFVAEEVATVQALIPLSRWAETILCRDSDTWSALRNLLGADEGFALVMDGSQAGMLMAGLPTEEAWDEFLGAAKLASA